MKAKVLLLLILIAALALGCGNKTSEITVYTSIEEDQIPVYLKSFKEQHPDIEVNIVRDSTGIITAKLLAEKENPQADVVWGLAATSLLVLDKNELLEGYAPRGVERILPQFKDNNNPPHWVGIDAYMTAFVVNTVELEKKGIPIPTSYQDLTKNIYKGMIVMPNPASSGTGFLTVSAFMQLFGEQNAWNYMDMLDKNVAIYTHSGSKPAKMAAQGEYPIGISFDYRGIIEKRDGAPVVTVFPTEGSGWELEANALIKKTTIKEEAKLFLDWAISDKVMQEYSKRYAIITIENDNPVPEGFPNDPMKQLIPNDLKWAAENRDRILEEWNRRYQSKSE